MNKTENFNHSIVLEYIDSNGNGIVKTHFAATMREIHFCVRHKQISSIIFACILILHVF